MKPALAGRSIAVWFGLLLLLYLAVFYGIEHWRRSAGPWSVQCLADGQGQPSVVVNQAKLGIRNVQITFAGETVNGSLLSNLPFTVVFDQPLKPVPFGRRLHEDLTTLPGVETFDLFGHIVELAPRVLALNQARLGWSSNTNIMLWPTNKAVHPLGPSPAMEPSR